jgi:hypothetical protein
MATKTEVRDAPAEDTPAVESVPADEVEAAQSAEDEEGEVAVPEALEAFYQRASGVIRAICERERTAIVLGRREQQRQATLRFRTIRDALWEDKLYLKDWCAAAGEDYRSIAQRIERLEEKERREAKERRSADTQKSNEQAAGSGGAHGTSAGNTANRAHQRAAKKHGGDSASHNRPAAPAPVPELKFNQFRNRDEYDEATASLDRIVGILTEDARREDALLYALAVCEGRPVPSTAPELKKAG